ncbi:hypothetical protein K435DRAFT_961959 [Dendrothele bispora CBS 962.96]|uniref:Zn(2)-C6 fungal-type domain-containing protein n=1 Tax=Dendrothele bispora (strain CBS 962.96) TaxID=1314807 RepID=A0A4S8MN50_DENBC|nr:hypothetical protein K435DRAFT_961959 [Dendrothele bispora CBS 962.96]
MSGNTSQRMPRGGSCSNCRHRKIKCDGALPRCSNCERSTGGFHDCEYPGRGSSQIEYLEQQIRELESQIQERETSTTMRQTIRSGSVVLRDPYLTPTATQAQSAWTPSRAPSAASRSNSEEVPLELRKNLLSAFIPYANDLGFFLDLNEICTTMLTFSQGTSCHARSPLVTPPLMHVIFLWSSRLSTSAQVTVLEPEFLSRATNSVPHILSHPTSTVPALSAPSNYSHQKVLEAIQSHILLAQYFFHADRKLEGQYSVNVAISLVLGTDMHRIRSEEVIPAQGQLQMALGRSSYTEGGPFSGSQTLQTQLQREKEEAQRINAFWMVLALNSRWAAVEGHSSSLLYWTPGMRVDTPWPQVKLTPTTCSSYTIQRFLSNTPDDAHSTLALFAKACILFEQAFKLTSPYQRSQSSPDPNLALSAQNFLSVLHNLTSLTTRFISRLPSINSIQDFAPSDSVYTRTSNSGSEERELLVIHTLARVTIIRLYTLFEIVTHSGTDERMRTHRLKIEAANESAKMIDLVDGKDMVFIDSIMAMLWPIIYHVLTTEIRLLGQARGGQQDPKRRDYRKSVSLIDKAMSGLAPSNPLMDERLRKMQELSPSV